ncbi:MAG: hypothetical protein KJZ65_04170 [Phycisphaerales bacterium]|nr:hypothetical protein [Phycisphaerales bacterium]
MRSRRIRTVSCILVLAFAESGAMAQSADSAFSPAEPTATSLRAARLESLHLGDRPLPRDAQGAGAKTTSQGSLGVARTLGAMVGVVGLVLACAFAWRSLAQKRGGLIATLGPAGRAPSGVIEVLARYPVARTQKLVLLRVGRRIVLACQSGSVRGGAGSMSTLAEFSDPDDVAALLRSVREADNTGSQAEFREALRSLERQASSQPLSTQVEYRAPSGDSVHLSDPRIQIPRPAPSGRPVDPSIGLLRSRLAAMRLHGDAA